MPVQSSLTVTLPLDGGGRYDNLNPFPGNQPTIVKFEDKVEVMASLVRPKKITILASDGQKYVMMCKPDVSSTPTIPHFVVVGVSSYHPEFFSG